MSCLLVGVRICHYSVNFSFVQQNWNFEQHQWMNFFFCFQSTMTFSLFKWLEIKTKWYNVWREKKDSTTLHIWRSNKYFVHDTWSTWNAIKIVEDQWRSTSTHIVIRRRTYLFFRMMFGSQTYEWNYSSEKKAYWCPRLSVSSYNKSQIVKVVDEVNSLDILHKCVWNCQENEKNHESKTIKHTIFWNTFF